MENSTSSITRGWYMHDNEDNNALFQLRIAVYVSEAPETD